MTKRLLIAVFTVGLMAPLPATFAAETATGQGGAAPAPAPPRAPTVSPAAAPPSLQDLGNIQLDLTITDTQGGKPVRKTVSMLLRNGSRGSIRSSGQVPIRSGDSWTMQSVSLNLDAGASPVGLRPQLIQVSASFELATPSSIDVPSGAPMTPTTHLTERIEITVQNGRPTVVSKSADALSDRTVTVELTATIREP